jgi:chitinase
MSLLFVVLALTACNNDVGDSQTTATVTTSTSTTSTTTGTTETGSTTTVETGHTTTTETGTATTVETGSTTTTTPPTPVDKRIIGYFAEWAVYDRDYHVWDIPVDNLTHINYAFANATTGGGCEIYDEWAALKKDGGNYNLLVDLKAANPGLKTLISVGGWTLSGQFSDIALTAASRAAFVNDCVDFMVAYGFDGIDIDWEYPVEGGLAGNGERPEDKENYTLLLAEFRDQIDAMAPGSLLTIAGPGGDDNMQNIEMAGIAAQVDWINIMSYDFHGGWESTTGHNAALYPNSDSPFTNEATYNADAAVQGYLDAGVPANKIVMGVPFYGRGWSGVPNVDAGLFQSSTGLPSGTWESGVYDYNDLHDNYVGAAGWTRTWDKQSQVPWLYNAAQSTMISYDDEESLALKANYIIDNNLGGAMFWELSGDTSGAILSNTLANFLK